MAHMKKVKKPKASINAPLGVDWRPSDSRTSPTNSPMLDLGRNMVPIYVQLVTIFRRLIANGQWALNAQIPTLDNLSEEFGVARATIRQAIGLLENEGLLRRFRRRGKVAGQSGVLLG